MTEQLTTTFGVVSGIQNTLSLKNLYANVFLKKGARDEITILLEGTDEQLSKTLIKDNNNGIVIEHKDDNLSVGNNNINLFGCVVGNIGNGSVTYIGEKKDNVHASNIIIGNIGNGGVTYIGGKKCNITNNPINITIHMPKNWNLNIIQFSSSLTSTVALESINLNISGSMFFNLSKVKNVDIKCSGQSKGILGNINGVLKIRCAGQSNIRTNGTYSSVDIECSGQSKIDTNGTCKGNYKIIVSGMCKINHNGTIEGKVTKCISGMCNVRI